MKWRQKQTDKQKTVYRTEEMGPWSRVCIALPEDRSLIPNGPIHEVTAACNSTPDAPLPSSGLQGHMHLCSHAPSPYTVIHT